MTLRLAITYNKDIDTRGPIQLTLFPQSIGTNNIRRFRRVTSLQHDARFDLMEVLMLNADPDEFRAFYEEVIKKWENE